ncbi:peptidase S45 penicillin amidase [Catenulispora acidiphila DSM 44928]|uniref:Peptidase S45 penicillin amidase n=1 Tax=Catenulispora acidiphila (strain DSM 44928 / JCM 14897 / NBRC 102108 / NRRL B-24433 / ID139908) TaxID=479433 RepID=C7QII7_CATAD|nr:penicillin acylase family protein [Catenulispora acidiphila]ACU75064.1 peptidase S45 penicillin amidase [Catenulispora acidiphila DSM 44928]
MQTDDDLPEPAPAPDPSSEPEQTARRPRRRLRTLKIAAAVLAGLLVVAAGAGTWWLNTSLHASYPQTKGTLRVVGLQASVEVDRDAQGVPQLYASSSHDLFFAQGYVQAQDRFWQMDVYRHVTAGRLSEMFGSSQVDTDKFIRTMGWRDVAEQEYAGLSPETKAYANAYSDGVNAYLKDHKGSKASVEYAVLGLQTDYTPYAWTPIDSLSWLKALAWDLRDNMQSEIDRALSSQTVTKAQVDQLFPPYPSTHPTIVDQGAVVNGAFDQNATPTPDNPLSGAALPAAAASALANLSHTVSNLPAYLQPTVQGVGSNSWVVSGSLTTTGKPLLANDPHLAPQLPSIWYQMGLHCTTVDAACPYDVSGFTMPGTPGVVIGHTPTIAWGFTNGTEDVSDLVLEKVTGSTYEYDGHQVPLTVRQETIKVAGGKPVPITVRTTNQGPLVSDADKDIASAGNGYAVALRWTALSPGHTADALFALDRATDWTSFRAAAANFAVPSQNMIYADTSGNIGYQTPGQIPIRKNGDGRWPVPGWTDQYEWTGFIPFDQLPHVLNPTPGFVATANNPIIGSQYPYVLSEDFDYGYRANEITQRLQAATADGKKIDADGMRAIQSDTRNEFAAVLVPYLQRLPASSKKQTRAAAALFTGWDDTTFATSAAAAYFYEVWKFVCKDAFEAKLPSSVDVDGGDRWFAVATNLLPDASSFWWNGNRDALLAKAMDQASAELTSQQGSDVKKWQWGALHKLTPTNQTLGTGGPWFVKWLVNGDPVPVSGGSAVVDATGFDIAKDFSVDELPSMRMMVDLSHLDASTWVNLTGASGHVDDPHYLDQLRLWRTFRTLPWPSSRPAVLAATKDKLTLLP